MQENVERPAEIVTINCNAKVIAAANLMLTNKIGCLIVNDENEKFAGILTERDIVSRIVAPSIDISKLPVSEIMTTQVVCCPVGTPTSKAREIMAANRIRHLPIINNDVVIGILSARDLMGQQLLEDRAAAEEVAMLSNCLKSIELSEAADAVTKEVPKLFHAGNCVLCLFNEKSSDNTNPVILSYNECICPKEHLVRNADADFLNLFNNTNQKEITKNGKLMNHTVTSRMCDSIPEVCRKLGAHSPRLVIPILVSSNTSKDSKRLYGYLCMCGLNPASSMNRELTSYKAKLTREILTSHLTNASLYQQARLTSLTDALTGLGSRKLLEDKLQTEHERAKRYKHPFSVAIIDLDNFKTINDIFGHATGDEALKKLAECMKKQKRGPDILARYGGDEFVFLMPETKADNSQKLLERLRKQVYQIDFGNNMKMTISCGIAESIPGCKDASSEIMRRADIALYEAKSAGRNCIKLWNETMSNAIKTNDIEIDKVKKLKRRIIGLSEQAEKMFIQSIWGLVQTLESKSPHAKRHSENVTCYAVGIAEIMNLSSRQIEVIRRAAMLHDIGKIGIPDSILSKTDRLSPRERNIIEQHPLIAARILDKMSFLEQEIAIVRAHHEKWNGRGYPDGLSKKSIPVGARILAVADAFDALTSKRAYHDSISLDDALKNLVDSSGYDFDPKVVEGLVLWIEKVRNQQYKDQIRPKDLLNDQKQSEKVLMTDIYTEIITSGSKI